MLAVGRATSLTRPSSDPLSLNQKSQKFKNWGADERCEGCGGWSWELARLECEVGWTECDHCAKTWCGVCMPPDSMAAHEAFCEA